MLDDNNLRMKENVKRNRHESRKSWQDKKRKP